MIQKIIKLPKLTIPKIIIILCLATLLQQLIPLPTHLKSLDHLLSLLIESTLPALDPQVDGIVSSQPKIKT